MAVTWVPGNTRPAGSTTVPLSPLRSTWARDAETRHRRRMAAEKVIAMGETRFVIGKRGRSCRFILVVRCWRGHGVVATQQENCAKSWFAIAYGTSEACQ